MKKRAVSVVISVLIACSLLTGCKSDDYKEAKEMLESGDYRTAKQSFELLGNYKDSSELAKECDYQIALEKLNDGDFEGAVAIYESIKDYKNVAGLLDSMKSPCNDVSDKTFFYMTLLMNDISDDDFKTELKKSISGKVDELFDGDYSNTPGKEIYKMLMNLDQSKMIINELDKHIGIGKDDKKYAECIFAYYCLMLDNSCAELYSDSDHSVLYDLMLMLLSENMYDEYSNLNKTIPKMHDDFFTFKDIDDIDVIIILASYTVAGSQYEWTYA